MELSAKTNRTDIRYLIQHGVATQFHFIDHEEDSIELSNGNSEGLRHSPRMKFYGS